MCFDFISCINVLHHYLVHSLLIGNCVVLQEVAQSFCFNSPPKVNLNLESSVSKFRKKMRKVDGNRHGISASNPYGRKSGDTRQFTRF